MAPNKPRSFLPFRRLGGIFVVLLWIGTCAQGAPQVNQQALVRITASGDTVSNGTGFIISNNTIVTAYHVIREARRIDVSIGNQIYSDVVVIAVRPLTDIALLRVPDASASHGYYQTTNDVPGQAGSNIYIHGVPLGFDSQLLVGRLTQSGTVNSQFWSDNQGEEIFEVDNLALVPLDITAEVGMSGGPVMDEFGRVFGVFSGSLQAQGRGYAWAVPIFYLENQHMNVIERRASEITAWPEFVFLRNDLTRLRSQQFTTNSSTIARQCRKAIYDYTQSWDRVLEAGYQLSFKWRLMKPSFDELVQSSNPTAGQVEFIVNQVDSEMTQFTERQSAFEKITARLASQCYSYRLISDLMPPEIPPTRDNVLFGHKLTDRMLALEKKDENNRQLGKRIEQDAQKALKNMLQIMGLESSSQQQEIGNLLQIFGILETTVDSLLSADQSTYIAGLVGYAQSWAEIMELMELHPWEKSHREYSYRDPSGYSITLKNGWLQLDPPIRNALYKPGVQIPPGIRFVKVSSLGELGVDALAEVYWLSGYSGVTPSLANVNRYWEQANRNWSDMERREGVKFNNLDKRQSVYQNELILQVFGYATGISGEDFNAYQGSIFVPHGTATMSCFLLGNNLSFDMCNDVFNNIVIPN